MNIEKGRDKLLSGRTMTFAEDKRDELVAEFIDDIEVLY